jgi:hypothetical protein
LIDIRTPLLALTKRSRRITRGWKRSNCVSFALAIWWWRWLHRQPNNYVTWRLSRVRWGLVHCLHGRMGIETGLQHLVSYKPNTAEKRKFEPIFAGHLERGDKQHLTSRKPIA